MAAIDWSVVKSYDIRGKYPGQLDELFAYLLGRTLPQIPALEGASARAALGHDARLSSPALYAALIAGFRDAGWQAHGLGLCPTEFLYYAMGRDESYGVGVMVTASHNPPDYNGFKVVRTGGQAVTGPTGLNDACRLMEQMEAEPPEQSEPPPQDIEVADEYLACALDLAGEPDTEGLTAVVDAGNGVAGLLWSPMAESLGLEFVGMNLEPDGNFPAHHPDPTEPENLEALTERVQESGADVGFAYDGDADRVMVVLSDGHLVDGSEMTGCIAHRMLRREPPAMVGMGQTVSRKVTDYFRARGVEPVMVPVGHAKIKAVMRTHGQMSFAGEHAGHYYYREFYCCDSALLTTLHVLELLGDGQMQRLVNSLPGPWHRPEGAVSVEFDDQEHALEVCRRVGRTLVQQEPGYEEITCEKDGHVRRLCTADDIPQCAAVRVDYADWWFCVRPSGTEPIARLVVEATSADVLQQRVDRLEKLFEEHRRQ